MNGEWASLETVAPPVVAQAIVVEPPAASCAGEAVSVSITGASTVTTSDAERIRPKPSSIESW